MHLENTGPVGSSKTYFNINVSKFLIWKKYVKCNIYLLNMGNMTFFLYF